MIFVDATSDGQGDFSRSGVVLFKTRVPFKISVAFFQDMGYFLRSRFFVFAFHDRGSLFKDHYHYFDFLRSRRTFSLGDSFSKSQSTQTFMINIKVDFLRYGCTFGDIVVLLR